jgi:hypothetical protein
MHLNNQKFNWKSKLTAVVRWSLLAEALVGTLVALLTA